MFFGKKEEKPVENNTADSDNFQHTETVSERRLWQMKNVFLAFWIFVFFILIAIFAVGVLGLSDFAERVILWTTLTIIYAIILYFLLEPGLLRTVSRSETRTVEKSVEVPVYRDVIKTVEKPVIKEVIKEVPVYRDVIKTVDRPIPVPLHIAKRKLDIIKYDYVASSATKVYHKNNCRLSKSIKKKFKEHSNDLNDFKKKGYRPCKSCVTKQVKV